MSELSESIKRKAAELGFAKCGIVPVEPLHAEAGRFQGWLGRGFSGNMTWMEREPEKRADPKLIFPEARSLIALAMNYFTPHEHSSDAANGRISRYAWGDDYHDILKRRLYELLEWIKAEAPETRGKVCVDTAPIMEKAWAVRAGLGWIGKQCRSWSLPRVQARVAPSVPPRGRSA